MENGGERQEEECGVFLEEIDWENFLQSIPDPVLLFTDDLNLESEPSIHEYSVEAASSNPSPSSDSSLIGDIEHFLLDEDCVIEEEEEEDTRDFSEDFFSGIFLNPSHEESKDASVRSELIPSPGPDSVEENEEKSDGSEENDDGDEFSPMSKKQKRQMRNRDSAMRSRERKKVYVKDLEMKSKYLEGECRRLEYALRCCVIENQILYQRLQHRDGKDFDVSSTKQESAVLPLESLLLGSLFWLVSIVCLFLPSVPSLTKPTVVMGTAGSWGGNNGQEIVESREAGNEILQLRVGLNFMKRRCKATRMKMKAAFFNISPHSFMVRSVCG